MIPIAAVLLLIVLVLSIAVVVSNPGVFDLSIFGAKIAVNTAGVYFTGAGAMLVALLAASLLRTGIRRSMAKRHEISALRRAAGEGGATRSGSDRTPSVQKAAPATGEPGATGAAAATRGASQPHRAPTTPAGAPPASGTPAAGTTEAAERQALLEEADELTGEADGR